MNNNDFEWKLEQERLQEVLKEAQKQIDFIALYVQKIIAERSIIRTEINIKNSIVCTLVNLLTLYT